MANITLEEKVEYIYKELKRQKKTRHINFVLKIIIIIIFIFWIISINNWLTSETITSKISSTLWTIAKPIINDLVEEMSTWTTESEENIPNKINESIGSELINNTQNNDN